MTFWTWADQHWLFVSLTTFALIFLADAVQQNFFKWLRSRKSSVAEQRVESEDEK